MRNWVVLFADGDYEQRLLYKPAAKSVRNVPGEKPSAKKKQSSSAHNQGSSAKVHAQADPVPDKGSATLVFDVLDKTW